MDRGGRDRPRPREDPRGGPDLGAAVAADWRSLLFVPGTRLDRYPKALASGADLVCVDLEDAVATQDKDAARAAVVALAGGAGWRREVSAVRVNPVRSREGRADVEALATEPGIAADGALVVVVPKVDGPDELDMVREPFEATGASVRLVAMIETARGLEAAPAIAAAPAVAAVFLGAVDLAAELGCAIEWDALLYARSRLVHAVALAGGGRVRLLDVPFLALDDLHGLEAETRAVSRLGFTGKAAIHPRQIEPIHAAFAPTRDDLDRARRILEAYDRAGGGVLEVDGRMVDRPVVEAARRMVARATTTSETRWKKS